MPSEPNVANPSSGRTPASLAAVVVRATTIAATVAATWGVAALWCVRPQDRCTIAWRAIVKMMRDTALMQASVHANMLTAAPMEIATPRKPTPAAAARSSSGAGLSCIARERPENPSTSM